MKENFIEIRLVNEGDSGVGLRDTQSRVYSIPVGGQLRIGSENLRELLDNPISRKMICSGLVKVVGVTEEMLYGTILTDQEKEYLLSGIKKEEPKAEIVEEEEEIQEVELFEEVALEPEEKEEIIEIKNRDESPIIKALTFYNWIKNEKADKIREAVENPVNYDTLKDIALKNEKYNTDLVKEILS